MVLGIVNLFNSWGNWYEYSPNGKAVRGTNRQCRMGTSLDYGLTLWRRDCIGHDLLGQLSGTSISGGNVLGRIDPLLRPIAGRSGSEYYW